MLARRPFKRSAILRRHHRPFTERQERRDLAATRALHEPAAEQQSAAGVANGMSPRGRAGKRQVKAQEVSALGADDEFWGQEAWGDDDADDSFDEAAVSDDGEVSRALPLIRL
jgi:hypothetical protein